MRWFKPVGMLFLPSSMAGWCIVTVAAIFCVHIFLMVDRHSHSVSDTIYGVFPFWVPALLAVAWIADRTGGRA